MELYSLLESTLSGLGYEMIDLEISNRGKLLRLFIDKPEGITIDDCSLVSNHLSRLLAVEMDFDYDRLEVSSPGLDRPLKKTVDFERFKGDVVALKLRVALLGRKKFEGVLVGIQAGKVLLIVDGNEVQFDFDNIDKARLVPKF